MDISRILIVEDQTDIRHWIVNFVAEIFPLAELIQAANLQQACRKIDPLPQLLLVDLSLPDGRGYELISQVKQQNVELPCVVITSFEDDDFLFPALKAGADGYMLKDQTVPELKKLLQGILTGKPPISPAIAHRLFNYFRQPQEDQTIQQLTLRERETLKLIARGFSVKECARKMDISHHTVAGYIKEIYRKLQINSRAEAALKATKYGL
jgi:DNA-binding NarL/FixJ family response regulator